MHTMITAPDAGVLEVHAHNEWDNETRDVRVSVPQAPATHHNTLPFTALGTTNRRILSSLALVQDGFVVHGTHFLSVEAAHVCLFKFGGAHADVFNSDGVLGSMSNFLTWWHSLADYERTSLGFVPERWRGVDGIFAKLAGSSTRVGKHIRRLLGLGVPVPSEYEFEWGVHAPLWRELLQAKYDACAAFRAALYQTRFFYLYEADTKCARKTGRTAVWGGCFDKRRVWHGRNIAGRLLMDLRMRNGVA